MYIKCEGKTAKSRVKKDSLNPEWNYSAIFYRRKPQQPIVVEVHITPFLPILHSISFSLHPSAILLFLLIVIKDLPPRLYSTPLHHPLISFPPHPCLPFPHLHPKLKSSSSSFSTLSFSSSCSSFFLIISQFCHSMHFPLFSLLLADKKILPLKFFQMLLFIPPSFGTYKAYFCSNVVYKMKIDLTCGIKKEKMCKMFNSVISRIICLFHMVVGAY